MPSSLGSRRSATSELKAKTPYFKELLANGATLDEILPEAFAVVREASRRVLRMRHFDVQLIGGMVLHGGKVAEMRTGEGKTLTATLPLYLNGLAGKGAHLVTVNDYLARRDAEWMGRLYNWLGLSVGVVQHGLTDEERREAYGCDITYATNNEIGFDYLRDNMKWALEDFTQRGFIYAIVDEVDSILIDEARTPLIIAGSSEEDTSKYFRIDAVVPKLSHGRGLQGRTRRTARSPSPTTASATPSSSWAWPTSTTPPPSRPCTASTRPCWPTTSTSATWTTWSGRRRTARAWRWSSSTSSPGRMMPGRRWSNGLHQAIEAKEGVEVNAENQTLATVTFQNFFRMYKTLAGMTGTAETEAAGAAADLQAGSGRHPHQHAHDPHRLRRHGLLHQGRQEARPSWRRSRSCTPRASRCWWAPPASRAARTCPTP